MSGTLHLDLHVHSRYSPDSSLTVREIAHHLVAAGLDGFALTDHNSVRGQVELEQLQHELPDLVLLPGVEVSTREGHLLAYGVREAPPVQQPIGETIEWIVAHGGVGVPAHPFRVGHGIGGRVLRTVQVPAIEVLNGHSSSWANSRARRAAAERRLGGTGGSDVHQLADLGRAYTEFPSGLSHARDLLETLRRGNTVAGGRSLRWGERANLAARTALLRIRRGFRPI